MKNRGELQYNEMIGLILAVMAFAALLLFAWTLFSYFNVADEGAKSYFESFKEQLIIADKGETTEFSLWFPETEAKKYVLVYFDEKNKIILPSLGEFITIGNPKNRVCICTYNEKKTKCKPCEDLDKSLMLEGTEEPFTLRQGETITITKGEETYLVVKKK